MNGTLGNSVRPASLIALRRFLKPREVRERCDLCSAEVGPAHSHLFELASRRLLCACDPCAILFSNATAAKYQRVPQRVEYLADLRLDELQWQSLQLPINLAFFVPGSTGRVVALYPSPGGATEALPPPDAWASLVEENPILGALKPDIEALLVNRLGTKAVHFIVSIDKCYALVGLVRMHWRGLSGGNAVWQEIDRFFAELQTLSETR